ncbi:aminotransferase class V-fold PLP-dependent enzyme [Ramlibacter sp.]|uniref:aminotransferase class V-fold PLP-dependent enzyme n=1 Tax=Ramlibacter sp. TaxID=1917967 RepID=UPI003D10BD01
MHHEIYLDANATTPVLPAALAAASDTMQASFGNPSSSHSTGLVARELREDARASAARLLGSGEGTVLFVSGATEAIQTAVLSSLCELRERRKRGDTRRQVLVYGATEHKAVPESLAHWNRLLGLELEIRALPVNAEGLHDLELLRAWAPEIGMLCTMAANNETGVVSDLAGIERALVESASPALWLVDCVQALGKLALDLKNTRIDYAAFSGHKLHAPKGIGMLYVREGSPCTPLVMGGGQEGGWRSGTENMPGIAALGAVLSAACRGDTFKPHETLHAYRDRLVQALRDAFPGVAFNAPLERTLPTTLNFSVPGVSSRMLMDLFEAAGVRVSAGSACSAAKAAPSYVLEAMGLAEWRTTSAVRMSFGPLADEAFIDAACAAIRDCGRILRDSASAIKPSGERAANDADAAHVRALDWRELDTLLQRDPQALLIDVRERFEVAAAAPVVRAGKTAVNVPLTEIEQEVPRWMLEHAHPLVFFCRSGNRSLQATLAVQREGHVSCIQLSGGLALQAVR